MTVIKSTKDDLRNFLYEKQFVIVMFDTKGYCPACDLLIPVFERLSKKYNNITFVTKSADDNPVAKQLIDDKKQPFFGVYKEGLLVACSLVSSESELTTMLNKLPNINFEF